MTRDGLAAFEERFGHKFKNRAGLERALTHASTGADRNYERLEFLGDRVLGLVIAHLLYDAYPEDSEGDLARRHAALVSGATLATIANSIRLGEVLNLSESERASGGAENENILADVMEALIGTLYIDGGVDECELVIAKLWKDVLHTMQRPPQDPKTALQEWAQARALPLPKYEMTGRKGPDHAPEFTIRVTVNGMEPESGEGPSRRAAEKAAALKLLERIGAQQ